MLDRAKGIRLPPMTATLRTDWLFGMSSLLIGACCRPRWRVGAGRLATESAYPQNLAPTRVL
ncbi:hypothetical protein GCM10027273_14120 [Nocardioides pakistanensis]